MALTSGTKLGPYEIVSALGAGGMGEVYRARDTRLDRTVAVKILPSHLSSNPEAKQRFEREARAISSLSHPHICHLYDVGSQDGTDFLVMEYLEGETLADRLRKGPLPMEQLLHYGVEIAEGLEKAHRSGVVHRDLKPGNVMLTKSGAKLMDFGLAKAATPANPPSSGLTQTLASPHQPLTAEGMVVGTFQYMSPEQIEGRDADARSDIFALGAVLYEMVTGKRAFEGKTAASTIAAILASEPKPISVLQPLTPPALDHVIRNCLAKDADQRWQSCADVARELQWISQVASQPASAAAQHKLRAPWLIWAVVSLAAVAAAFWLGSSRRIQSAPIVQFQVDPPEKTYFNFRGLSGPPVPSPDGKNLAFVASVQGQTGIRALWLRALDTSEARLVPGSDGAVYPFWSPDSRLLAFFASGKLKKFDLAASSLMTLCDVAEGRGGAWSTDGVILFGNRADSLFRVNAEGGAPTRFTTLDEGRQETSHRWPQFLPDQKHFLFVTQAPLVPPAHLMVASLDSPQGMMLDEITTSAIYSQGYLFYTQENNLLARRFAADRLQLSGEPVVLARQVQNDAQFNFAAFSVNGSVLAYQTGAVLAGTRLVVFDRSGKETILSRESDLIQTVALSPAGDQIAAGIGIASGQLADVWIYNLQRNSKTRLTFDQRSDNPVWSPDGLRIMFSRTTPDGNQIVIKNVSGTGSEEVVHTEEGKRVYPVALSPDGRYLLYRVGLVSSELKALPFTGERKPVSLLTTKMGWTGASLSPDGKWLAYTSAESGTPEIYVVPFQTGAAGPSIGQGKWQISNSFATTPIWRPDGKELFFTSTAATGLMSVRVNANGDHFESDTPKFLFDLGAHPVGVFYAPTRDGQKVYMSTYGPGSSAPFTVTVNWQQLLPR